VATGFRIEDLAWMTRESAPVLWLATTVGLYEYTPGGGAGPVQVVVDPQDPRRGFYAVAVAPDVRGSVAVAVAARSLGGVFLSSEFGRSHTFQHIGLEKEDVRLLAVQQEGTRRLLWAGFAASPGEPGKGAAVIDLIEGKVSGAAWQPITKGWSDAPRQPGTCWSLAFVGMNVLAGSHQAGVMTLNADQTDAGWTAPSIDCGLPHREIGRIFHRVEGLDTDRQSRLIVVGGPAGVYRSRDGGATYEPCSGREFEAGKVTLPEAWLFCSGEHDVVVLSDDDARRT
jgi:hypothetical protein